MGENCDSDKSKTAYLGTIRPHGLPERTIRTVCRQPRRSHALGAVCGCGGRAVVILNKWYWHNVTICRLDRDPTSCYTVRCKETGDTWGDVRRELRERGGCLVSLSCYRVKLKRETGLLLQTIARQMYHNAASGVLESSIPYSVYLSRSMLVLQHTKPTA